MPSSQHAISIGQAQLSILKEKLEFLSLFNDEGICLYSHKKIWLTNKRFNQIFGYKGSEIIAIENLFSENELEAFHHWINENNIGIFSAKGHKQNGNYVNLEIRHRLIKIEDSNYRFLLFKDVSEFISKERLPSVAIKSPILDTALDAFILADTRGNIVDVNHSYCQISGYSREELLRMNMVQLEGRLSPAEIGAKIAGMLEAGGAHFETAHKRKDGKLIEFSVNISIVQDDNETFVAAFCRDISEQKNTERALRQSEERFRQLYHNSPNMYASLNLDSGTVMVCNQTFMKRTGYTQSELIGQPILKVFDESCHDKIRQNFHEFLKTGVLRNKELILKCKDGQLIHVLLNTTAVRDEVGNLLYSMSSLLDISKRKAAEAELFNYRNQLEEQVKTRTAALEQANEELKSFSYSVSHDLRGPLNRLDGFSKAIQKNYAHVLDEKGLHFLERIRVASKYMSKLIDDMLVLARVSQKEILKKPVDLTALSQEILHQLAESAPENQVEIEVEENLLAEMDPGLCRLMMENLLRNAWKFSEKKPFPKIIVGKEVQDGKEWFFVKDNGIGFDMKYYDQLFIPFKRLHSNVEVKGSGIGLATVRRVINKHSGQIKAVGKTDAGATFYFYTGG